MVENHKQVLKNSGMRVTAARLAVLAALEEYPHSDADFVREEVNRRLGYISGQAVYDALNALTLAGVIRRIQPAGNRASYELFPEDNHHHMVCINCNKMLDVPCAVGAAPCAEPNKLPNGWTLNRAELIYWGICADCAHAEAAVAAR